MSAETHPRAHGAGVLSASMRTTPEDFRVEEIDAFEATGSGEHLLLTIEKTGMNTAFAASCIARWAGIAENGVSYAGLKDRHAITRQRFSVHLPKRVSPDPQTLEDGDFRVLKYEWHARKLPRGTLAGNRFDLHLRNVAGEVAAIDVRLHAVADHGVPNYFGQQRFGRGGDNVARALAMFAGRGVRREQRTLLLSAARSQLFNRVLAARVEQRNWDRPLDGEVWLLDGSRSVFGPEPWSEVLAERLAAFDIHPTAPLWGRGDLRTRADALALEQAALADAGSLALRTGLEREGLRQERRATRLRPQELRWNWVDDHVLHLDFTLPPGTYATTVLAELGAVDDAAAAAPDRSSESNSQHWRCRTPGV